MSVGRAVIMTSDGTALGGAGQIPGIGLKCQVHLRPSRTAHVYDRQARLLLHSEVRFWAELTNQGHDQAKVATEFSGNVTTPEFPPNRS